MSEDGMYKRAERRVDANIGFHRHLVSYLCVNVFLFIVNFLTSPGEWWFVWVAGLWGIGLVIHFIKVYIIYERFDEGKREEMIEKEMNKMKK